MINAGEECLSDGSTAHRLVCFVNNRDLVNDYLLAHDAEVTCSPSFVEKIREKVQVYLLNVWRI